MQHFGKPLSDRHWKQKEYLDIAHQKFRCIPAHLQPGFPLTLHNKKFLLATLELQDHPEVFYKAFANPANLA